MTGRHEIPTSLGPALVPADGVWALDVSALPVLHGLSVLSRALAEMVVAQARSDRIDVTIERRLRDRENPELIEDFGIELVKLAADVEATAAILTCTDLLETRLRSLLGSLQRSTYRDALLPQARAASKALVAEFGDGEARQRFVLEHVLSRREPVRGAFRITIEAGAACRLDLQTIPHVRIERVEDRHFIAGSTRIAQTWAESLRREAERGRRSFFEMRSPHSHLFRQLDQAGLASIQRVALQWSETALPFLLENDPAEVSELLKRVLLTLEDRNVRELLSGREVVRVDTGSVPVFLDVAQLGRVLLLSLGQRRERADAAAFLQRMPSTAAVSSSHDKTQPLRGVKIFLVHHMTGEVVGLIAALRALGCRDLTCLFVAYAGEPPVSYLDAILDLPPDEFRALALVHVPDRNRVEGHYRLSSQYSRLDEVAEIEAALRGREGHYLEAMRAVAIVPFLRQVARAEAAGENCLLVEDGGYLGPVVQEAMLQGSTVQAFAARLGHTVHDPRPLGSVLMPRLVGTVEHTRNGFDRLCEVERKHGRLALPAFSIAISKRKRVVEAREVATSVLGAIETVLNAGGRILSRRSCLVLGSRGAIGAELCKALGTRLDAPEQCLLGDQHADHLPGREPERLQHRDVLALDEDAARGDVGDGARGGEQRDDPEQGEQQPEQPVVVRHRVLHLLPGGVALDGRGRILGRAVVQIPDGLDDLAGGHRGIVKQPQADDLEGLARVGLHPGQQPVLHPDQAGGPLRVEALVGGVRDADHPHRHPGAVDPVHRDPVPHADAHRLGEGRLDDRTVLGRGPQPGPGHRERRGHRGRLGRHGPELDRRLHRPLLQRGRRGLVWLAGLLDPGHVA